MLSSMHKSNFYNWIGLARGTTNIGYNYKCRHIPSVRFIVIERDRRIRASLTGGGEQNFEHIVVGEWAIDLQS